MTTGRIGLMPLFKSKLEEKVWATLKKEFPTVKYEPQRFKFIQPEIERTYIPDLRLDVVIYSLRLKASLI